MPLARCPLGDAMDVAEILSPVSTHGWQGSLENPGARDDQKVASSPSGPMFSEMMDPGQVQANYLSSPCSLGGQFAQGAWQMEQRTWISLRWNYGSQQAVDREYSSDLWMKLCWSLDLNQWDLFWPQYIGFLSRESINKYKYRILDCGYPNEIPIKF